MRFAALALLPIGVAAGQVRQPTDPSQLPRYELTVAIGLGTPSLSGSARITLPPSTAPRDSIAFALSELYQVSRAELRVDDRVVQVVRQGKKERPYSRPGWGTNTWSLITATPIPAGKAVQLDVQFSTGAGPMKALVFSLGREAAFASGQTSAWYPEIEEAEPHPTGRLRGLRATGDVEFVIDTGASIYFPAGRVSRTLDGARQRQRFRVSSPTYFSFGMGRFTQTGTTYYLKPRATARANDTLGMRVLRVLEREFGPHPFHSFAVVEVPAADADSAGFAGASADGFILATSEFLDRPFNTAYYGHEIAHQWWGVMVRVSGARGNWMLSEGMSQFGSLRAVEELDPPAVARRYRSDEYPGYLGQGAKNYFDAVSKGRDAPLADLPLDGEWSRLLADSKGFMAWNALSLLMGRDEFRRALKGITSRYSTSRITWESFARELTQHTAADVARFFADWFDRPGIPEWEVRRKSGAAVLVQLGQPYLASVRIDVRTPKCKPRAERVVLTGTSTPLPASPSSCGRASYDVDPTYEIIHLTPELRRRFGRASKD